MVDKLKGLFGLLFGGLLAVKLVHSVIILDDPIVVAVYFTFSLTFLYVGMIQFDIVNRIRRLLGLIEGFVITVYPDKMIAKNLKNGKTARLTRKNPHPRMLSGDFFELEADFKDIVGQLAPKRFAKLNVLITQIGNSEGGYTNIENRAFREAVLSSGVSKVFLSEQKVPEDMAYRALIEGKLEPLD